MLAYFHLFIQAALFGHVANVFGMLIGKRYAIKKDVDGGKVTTWSYDNDGDFTHTSAELIKKAWFRPKVYLGELRFGLIGLKEKSMSKGIYGRYHSRLSNLLLINYDSLLTSVNLTSNKTEPDNFT